MSPPIIDMTGKVYDRLTVMHRAPDIFYGSKRAKTIAWLCRCSCGKETVIAGFSLRTGASRSCGCLASELASERYRALGKSNNYWHGHAKKGQFSPTFNSWRAMNERCGLGAKRNPRSRNYQDVSVCGAWKGAGGFANFLADMGERPEGMTLDRFPDPSGNYEPSNCRWATDEQQRQNKRSK